MVKTHEISIKGSTAWQQFTNNNYMIINNDAGIRPVINLRSDVEITGSGTTSDNLK